MTFGLAFWILMFIWLIWGVLWNRGWGPIAPYGPYGNGVMIFILFVLLGWHAFGAPLHN